MSVWASMTYGDYLAWQNFVGLRGMGKCLSSMTVFCTADSVLHCQLRRACLAVGWRRGCNLKARRCLR